MCNGHISNCLLSYTTFVITVKLLVMNKSLLSTRVLTAAQQELILNSGLGLTHFNILIFDNLNRDISTYSQEEIIITSKQALLSISPEQLHSKNAYVIGEKTSDFAQEIGMNVVATFNHAKDLATHIITDHSDKKFLYLSGVHYMEELPQALKAAKINFTQLKVYDATMVMKTYGRIFDAVLFFSPRGVNAFAKANPGKIKKAICIGETTAAAAREFTSHIAVATKQTVENTIVTAVKALLDD